MIFSGLLMLAIQASSATSLPPAPPTAASDEQSVLNSVNALLAAFNGGDPAEVLRWVYPDGRLTGAGTFPNRKGIRSESWREFTTRLGNSRFQETISNRTVKIDGDAAMVWASFVVRVGGQASNCGTDHFDLVREKGGWKTMNLTFSSRITGCPAQ